MRADCRLGLPIASLLSVGDAISVQLAGNELGHLQEAASRAKEELLRYADLSEIATASAFTGPGSDRSSP